MIYLKFFGFITLTLGGLWFADYIATNHSSFITALIATAIFGLFIRAIVKEMNK